MSYSIEWLELLTRVMGDNLPSIADAAYLVGETKDNAQSVWDRGRQLLDDSAVDAVAIQKGGFGFGYVGFEPSYDYLVESGVSEKAIVTMPILDEFEQSKNVNTLTEFVSLVRLAKEKNWEKIVLVAPHFHQLRVFFTGVTVVDHEYPELKLYNCPGTLLPWNAKVVHSQGTLFGTRLDFIKVEIERIQRYQQGGNPYPLVSLERILEYLNQRDV